MLPQIQQARPEIAPWAIRVAAQAPPLTPEQIRTCRAAFSAAGCLCGCAGPDDPACIRRIPIRVTVDYSQQCAAGPLGWPTSAA